MKAHDIPEFARASAPPRRGRPTLRLIRCEEEAPDAVPIFDLRIAAGAFSERQAPEAEGWARIEGATPRLFVAQEVGDSMDRVAPMGSRCLWQYTGAPGVAAAATREAVAVRRPDGIDPELGQFTFMRLSEIGGRRRLAPMSQDPEHHPNELTPDDEVEAVARFVAMVDK